MAKNYKVGENYYLPVTVYVDKSDDGGDFPIGIKYNDGKVEIRDYIQDTPGLLLTAEEVVKANGLYTSPCDERYDAQVDLVTARAAIDHLQEENKKLKQELKDAEASYNVVADTSLERKNRVATMEEVIVALVEKIRRLKGGET